MITNQSKNLLNRRPHIQYVAPRSGFTIPEPQKSTTPATPKEERVNQIIAALDNLVVVGEQVEKLVADRVKDLSLKLNLSNPEDAVVATAAARQFPELAKDKDGFKYIDEITFTMYNHCLQEMKAAGKAAGGKQEIRQENSFKPDKTDFGGQNKDKRPDVNQSTIPFAPIDIPAFVAAGIPLMFGLLFPLINATVKANIVGHLHPVPAPPAPTPVPSGPGVPLVP